MLEIKKIYEQYSKDVYLYLYSLTHDTILSEDLTSETFLGALRSLISFKGNSDIKTWLFSIARHNWYNYLRKNNKNNKEMSFEELSEYYLFDGENAESNIIKKEAINKIQQLLDDEPERNRNIVLMRIEGYSFAEIGSKYDISESSARVIDFRVKNKKIFRKGESIL